MALSRAQVFNELLPGLNALFKAEYTKGYVIEEVMENPYEKEVIEADKTVLRNLWNVAFGDCVSTAEINERLEAGTYMQAVGQYLFENDILLKNHADETYYLAGENGRTG